MNCPARRGLGRFDERCSNIVWTAGGVRATRQRATLGNKGTTSALWRFVLGIGTHRSWLWATETERGENSRARPTIVDGKLPLALAVVPASKGRVQNCSASSKRLLRVFPLRREHSASVLAYAYPPNLSIYMPPPVSTIPFRPASTLPLPAGRTIDEVLVFRSQCPLPVHIVPLLL